MITYVFNVVLLKLHIPLITIAGVIDVLLIAFIYVDHVRCVPHIRLFMGCRPRQWMSILYQSLQETLLVYPNPLFECMI